VNVRKTLLLLCSWWRNICRSKINLTNRSYSHWLKDLLKRCVFKLRRKKAGHEGLRGHRLIGVADYSRRQAQHYGMPDWRTSSDGYWGRDDSSCHSSVTVLLERRAEAPRLRTLSNSWIWTLPRSKLSLGGNPHFAVERQCQWCWLQTSLDSMTSRSMWTTNELTRISHTAER